MKAQNAKRELVEDRFQHRKHMSFADCLHAANRLPLRDGVDGIDVKHPGLAVVLALMHGVGFRSTGLVCCANITPQIPRLAFEIGLAPLANRNLPALRVLHAHPLLAVHSTPTQMLDV